MRIHRLLSARNVFIDEYFTAKVGDFGLARDLDDDNYSAMTAKKVGPLKVIMIESTLRAEREGRCDFNRQRDAVLVDGARTNDRSEIFLQSARVLARKRLHSVYLLRRAPA